MLSMSALDQAEASKGDLSSVVRLERMGLAKGNIKRSKSALLCLECDFWPAWRKAFYINPP